MAKLISQPTESENLLIDALFMGLKTRSYEITRSGILKIPKVSNFERINFYLFKKYAFRLIDGLETFEEKLKDELVEMCLEIKKNCKKY